MRTNRLSLFLAVLVSILVVSPASAAPSLSLGSNASYQLNASFTKFDDCTSANLTIAALACGSTTPVQTGAFVSIIDDARCSTYGDASCQFSPSNVTVSVSSTVSWRNFGNLTHTVTSDSGAFNFNLPGRNNFTFISPLPEFSFRSAGSFSYHCSIHPWMKGEVVVVQPTPLPPTVQSFSLNGPVGWSVVGLDDNAQLEVTHRISVYNASATPPVRLYNESGLTGETVELSTRKDTSPGLNPFSFLNGIPFPNFGSFQFPGYGYPYFFPVPESYTLWWVNGPLKLGSTVEVLTIHSAIRGSESANLSSALGTHDAWTVSYENSEAFNQTQPPSQSNYYCYNPIPYSYPGQLGFNTGPVCYTSGSSNVLSLRLDYGEQSDLLFSLEATVDTYVQTTTVYPAGSFVYGRFFGPGIEVSSPVNVVRTSRTNVSANLKLAATNLVLSSRTVLPPTTGSGSPVSSPARPVAALWMYGTVSAIAAGLVGAGVWAVLRSRRKGELVPSFQQPSQGV